MVGLSEKTLLAFSIALSAFAPQSTPSSAPDDLLVPREYVYVVKEGDSLSSIAENKYGDKAYWTTIWNDNDWLENPNIIHSELKLTISTEKPFIIENPNKEFIYESTTPMQSVPINAVQKTDEVVLAIQDIVSEPQHGPLSEAQMTFLGNCEAGMNPVTNTGNGF